MVQNLIFIFNLIYLFKPLKGESTPQGTAATFACVAGPGPKVPNGPCCSFCHCNLHSHLLLFPASPEQETDHNSRSRPAQKIHMAESKGKQETAHNSSSMPAQKVLCIHNCRTFGAVSFEKGCTTIGRTRRYLTLSDTILTLSDPLPTLF